jgi:hypothetical protein
MVRTAAPMSTYALCTAVCVQQAVARCSGVGRPLRVDGHGSLYCSGDVPQRLLQLLTQSKGLSRQSQHTSRDQGVTVCLTLSTEKLVCTKTLRIKQAPSRFHATPVTP